MVKLRQDWPRNAQGQIDVEAAMAQLCIQHEHLDENALRSVLEWLHSEHPSQCQIGLDLAELLAQLNMDGPSVTAGMVYRVVREQRIQAADLQAVVGAQSTHLVMAVANLANSSLLEMSNSPLLQTERQDQVENIKRMLISLINDPRVAVIKLAERVMALRSAKQYEPERRQRIAVEASRVFAPLAGRLGIWQLKWELEDLALRYMHEQDYQEIAQQLKAKRTAREVQVEHIIDQVRGLLRSHGIDATVYGRAKNIYSIWNKMRNKGVSFEQVHDVRAVRVVVNSLAECYGALGVLHSNWTHIPGEFDDYIANPKENGYQSIHTAVTAADGRTLEIQIRTVAMHEDAELGVCAHWSYKDGLTHGATATGSYDAKMDWLRQVIEWHEDLDGTASLSAMLAQRVNEDRIFVSTPKGHVLDLPQGATGLDFAYRVHSDVGHACAGIRINGLVAPLYATLETGQQVEVVTQPDGLPQRDWLEGSLQMVRTDRARAKLHSYFRHLPAAQQAALGEKVLRGKLAALGLTRVSAQQLAQIAMEFDKGDISELWRALGAGELSSIDVLARWLQSPAAGRQMSLPGIETSEFPQLFRLSVVGDNRDGLLHDITQTIGDMNLSLSGITGRVSHPSGDAIIVVDVDLSDWLQGVKLVSYLGLLEGVKEIRRLPLQADAYPQQQ